MFFLTLLKHVMDSERGNFKAVRVNKFPCLTYENIYPKKVTCYSFKMNKFVSLTVSTLKSHWDCQQPSATL